MNPEEFRDAKRVFLEAVGRESSERGAFLDEAYGCEPWLRAGPDADRLPDRGTMHGLDERAANVFRLAGESEAGRHVLAISLHNRGRDIRAHPGNVVARSDVRIVEISLRGVRRPTSEPPPASTP